MGLAGRDIEVSSLKDIALANKEVVLSFDDGPVPGKTERILATLNEFGVKATFLMVGERRNTIPISPRRSWPRDTRSAATPSAIPTCAT